MKGKVKIVNFKQVVFVTIISLVLLSMVSFGVHKYYVSITKIEVSEKEKLVKIATHFFIDDFREVMKQRYRLTQIDFSNLRKQEKEQIKAYIIANFKLSINRTALELHYLGCELENELLYIYIEAPLKSLVKRFEIENRLLMDVFPEQKNKIDITYKNKVKSIHLSSALIKDVLFY